MCFWPHGVIAVQNKQDTAVMLGCSSVEISWTVFCETVVSWMALSFTERKWFLPPLSKTQNVPLFTALCCYFVVALKTGSVRVQEKGSTRKAQTADGGDVILFCGVALGNVFNIDGRSHFRALVLF